MAGLFERESELSRLRRAIVDRRGALLVIEGPAGIGKTRLLGEARAFAQASGVRTLAGYGGELEREFPFGVVGQLLGPVMSEFHPGELTGVAGRAAAALGLMSGRSVIPEPIDASTQEGAAAIVQGVFWLVAAVAERGPLLICVDDAHWCDGPSLRFIAYLAQRLGDVAVTVLLAARPGVTLVERPSGVLGLRPLSVAGSAALVRDRLGPDAEASFCEACHAASAGNPFLLCELLAHVQEIALPPTAEGAARVGALRPGSVTRSVLAVVSHHGKDAVRLAQSVAALGSGAQPRWARQLAGLTPERAAAAADALEGAHVLSYGGSLEFTHPLARAAVYHSIPPAQRALAHAQAARLLRLEAADLDRIAAQLLLAEPAADQDAVGVLVAAAARAERRGAPETAARYLRRALEEPPTVSWRGTIGRALGRARLRAGDAAGVEELTRAREASEDPRERCELALDIGRGLMLVDRATEARALFAAAVDELGESAPELRALLEAEQVGAALLDVTTAGEAIAALDRRVDRLAGASLGERLLLAYRSYFAAARGEPPARVVDLARRALATGDLASEQTITAFGLGVGALIFADHGENAVEVLDAAIDRARERGSTLVFAIASWLRAQAGYRLGRLAESEADGQAALAAGTEQWLTAPVGSITDVLIERGRLPEAEALYERHSLTDALFPNLLIANLLLDSRGRLRCAQGRFEEGLADLLAVGERLQAWQTTNPAVIAWRSSAALAHAALGQREAAQRLAGEELELARRFGAPPALGIALRTAGLLAHGPQQLRLLREAAAVLETSQARLELARALADLGAVLRRTGQRIEAREVLRRALDLAIECGASALAARAREELITAGARPRRERISGADALTASERRVAELAARGMTNREIAQVLFITIRTVKAHLSSAFAKLDITSRDELAAALTQTTHPDRAPICSPPARAS